MECTPRGFLIAELAPRNPIQSPHWRGKCDAPPDLISWCAPLASRPKCSPRTVERASHGRPTKAHQATCLPLTLGSIMVPRWLSSVGKAASTCINFSLVHLTRLIISDLLHGFYFWRNYFCTNQLWCYDCSKGRPFGTILLDEVGSPEIWAVDA